MTISSELINVPIRRVVIALCEDRALALSRVLNEHIVWDKTEAEYELIALQKALGGDFRSAEKAAAENAEQKNRKD